MTTAQQAAERRATVGLSVNEVNPPKCERCDAPLTTNEELNRRIDWAVDMCTPCLEIEANAGEPRIRAQGQDAISTKKRSHQS